MFFLKEIKDITLKELAKDIKNDKMFLQIKLFDFLTHIEIFDKNKKSCDSPRKTKNVGVTPVSTSQN